MWTVRGFFIKTPGVLSWNCWVWAIKKKRTKWLIELWTLKQETETDDDHATMRESFSLVQKIGTHAHIFCSFVWKHGWKTMESFPIWFNFLITSSRGNLWCPLLLTILLFCRQYVVRTVSFDWSFIFLYMFMSVTWPPPRKKQKRKNRNNFSFHNLWQTCQWYFVLTI